MRVLCTGHAGFVGGHLVPELREHGHSVAGVDLHGFMDYAGEHGNARWDLCEMAAVARVLDVFEPEVVVHLAAQVGRVFGERDLRHTIDSNTQMTATIARECGERGIRVLYASTSEVYGDHGNRTCFEDSELLLPRNLYGLSKRWGEDVLRLYAPDGLQVVRLSMPAGPGAPPGVGRRALDNILWQAHHRMQIPIHRGAERSWCHVADTVAGIRLVLEGGEAGYEPQAPRHGVYNVGRDDVPLSMHALAERCCDVAGAPYDLIELVAPPAAQTVVKRLSTVKLQLLGWEPQRELADILADTYDWVQRFDRNGYMEKQRLPAVEGSAAGLAPA